MARTAGRTIGAAGLAIGLTTTTAEAIDLGQVEISYRFRGATTP